MRAGSWIVRPVHVTVRIGEPIETAGFTFADRDRVIAEVRQRIEELLRLGRPSSPLGTATKHSGVRGSCPDAFYAKAVGMARAQGVGGRR